MQRYKTYEVIIYMNSNPHHFPGEAAPAPKEPMNINDWFERNWALFAAIAAAVLILPLGACMVSIAANEYRGFKCPAAAPAPPAPTTVLQFRVEPATKTP